jgi:hypothetical protein
MHAEPHTISCLVTLVALGVIVMCFSDASPLLLDAAACWAVPRGQALSVYATQTARLRVVGGRVWVTVDGPHACAKEADWILLPGQCVVVHLRQRLVVEAWARFAGDEAWLCWQALW